MSLRNYKPKWGKAAWTRAFPSQAAPSPDRAPRRVRSVSRSRQSESRGYPELADRRLREARARGEFCPVVANVGALRNGRRYGWPISPKLAHNHHIFGKRGALLQDERLMMCCSLQGHRWIHSNIEAARKVGWYAPRGWWNRQPPQDATVERNEWGGVRVTLADGTVLQ